MQDYDTSDLADFAETILKGCDTNRDGKVSKKVSLKYFVNLDRALKVFVKQNRKRLFLTIYPTFVPFSGADGDSDDFIQPIV